MGNIWCVCVFLDVSATVVYSRLHNAKRGTESWHKVFVNRKGNSRLARDFVGLSAPGLFKSYGNGNKTRNNKFGVHRADPCAILL